MLICHCLALTDRDIRATAEQGCARQDAAPAAGSACGGCRPQVELLVRGCVSASGGHAARRTRTAV